MQKVEFLNDKRESKTIKEIFINKPNIEMKEKYGQNMFGYKTDKIAFVLAPYYKFGPLEIMMEEVFFNDSTYDKNVVKKEINLVSKIINRINIETSDKIELANNVLKYWVLTIKDAKWKEDTNFLYIVRMTTIM